MSYFPCLCRLLPAAFLAIAASACTHNPVYEGATFIKPAEDISTAWIGPDGGIYLVPEKGVVVDQVIDAQGGVVQWATVGSYLNIPASAVTQAGDVVWLMIEGRKRKLSLQTAR